MKSRIVKVRGKWFWELYHPNGTIYVRSNVGYAHKKTAVRGFKRFASQMFENVVRFRNEGPDLSYPVE